MTRTVATLAALLVMAWMCPAATAAQPVQVFILAGQSNMQGHGVVSYDGPKDYNGGKGNLVWSMKHSESKDKMKHLRDAEGAWAQRDDVTVWYKVKDKVRRGPLTVGWTGYGGSSHIGPELQFGHVVGDAIDAPVLLIKTAWGGKSLHKDFRPPSAQGETGAYFTQMVEEVNEALGDLEGKEYELAGFIWQQGWNDMVDQEATAAYADNLVLFAKDVRAAFDAPGLPFIVGELGNGGEAKPGSGMAKFRSAQRVGTDRIANAVFVETAAFARPAEMSPNTGHGHHWFGNAESYFLVGDALGKAAVKMIKANKTSERPEHVPDGYNLAYKQTFDNKDALKDFVFTDPNAWRFGEEDGDGYLELHGKSDYKPKHRSPYNIALIKVGKAGSFVLDVDLKQVGKEYGHRDLCVFFGFNDPEHYYYTHMATKGDQNAHQVFIVNDKPRTPITTSRTKGVDWGKDQWKHIRVVRDADKGVIEVYFDDMDKPVQSASDKTFTSGYVGFGSFDDVGRVDNIRLWTNGFDGEVCKDFKAKP